MKNAFSFNQIHEHACTCSLCGNNVYDKGLHYGLNIPGHWFSWNSWYSIKYGPRHYVRWTNSWFKNIQFLNKLKQQAEDKMDREFQTRLNDPRGTV